MYTCIYIQTKTGLTFWAKKRLESRWNTVCSSKRVSCCHQHRFVLLSAIFVPGIVSCFVLKKEGFPSPSPLAIFSVFFMSLSLLGFFCSCLPLFTSSFSFFQAAGCNAPQLARGVGRRQGGSNIVGGGVRSNRGVTGIFPNT